MLLLLGWFSKKFRKIRGELHRPLAGRPFRGPASVKGEVGAAVHAQAESSLPNLQRNLIFGYAGFVHNVDALPRLAEFVNQLQEADGLI